MTNWLKTIGKQCAYVFIAAFTGSIVSVGAKGLESWSTLEHAMVGGIAAGVIAALTIIDSWATAAAKH